MKYVMIALFGLSMSSAAMAHDPVSFRGLVAAAYEQPTLGGYRLKGNMATARALCASIGMRLSLHNTETVYNQRTYKYNGSWELDGADRSQPALYYVECKD